MSTQSLSPPMPGVEAHSDGSSLAPAPAADGGRVLALDVFRNIKRILIRCAFKSWPGYYFFLVVTYLMHQWKPQIHPPWEYRHHAISLQDYVAQYPGHLRDPSAKRTSTP